MAYEIEQRGYNEIIRTLRRLDDSALTDNTLRRIGEYGVGALQGQPYPPERSGQTYRRTGALNRAWRTKRRGAFAVVISNPVRRKGEYYAEHVVGETQAWMHKDRWWRAKVVVERIIPETFEAAMRYIRAIWNG